MNLSRWFGGRKELMKADVAAAALGLLCSERWLSCEQYWGTSGLTLEEQAGVRSVMFLTHSAIVTQWLWIRKERPVTAKRIESVFFEYFKIKYSGLPKEEVAALNAANSLLTKKVNNLIEIAEDFEIDDREAPRTIVDWAEGWFPLVRDDDEFVKVTGQLHGTMLAKQVNTSIDVLGKGVDLAVFGEGML